MEFGWINLFGAVMVIIMLIPNTVYAIKNRNAVNQCTNKVMNLIEQFGRYGCILLMWLPLFVRKFGFLSVNMLLIYLLGNGLLLLSYIYYTLKKKAQVEPWRSPLYHPVSLY